MAKFCKFCGNEIPEGSFCECPDALQERKKENTKDKMKFSGERVSKESMSGLDFLKELIGARSGKYGFFEMNDKIVSDNIVPDKGEIPIRQYHVASLRSMSKFSFAEGRLQVTNKRVLFRAAGYSPLGTTELQHEFAIEEIAGIEIRRDTRIGVLNFVLTIVLIAFVANIVSDLFSSFSSFSGFFANVFAIVLMLFSFFVFFSQKGKYVMKLICLSAAMGALTAIGVDTLFVMIPIVSSKMATILASITLCLLVINQILIVLIPNLVIEIKTKSASSPIEIRRKESNGFFAFMFNMPKKEYTGFADVMPGKDIEKARKELGALINDINVFGDAAIDSWKED